MTPRLREITRGAGAALVLFGVIVVPPLVLGLAIGWPLPRSLPTWTELSDALSGATVSDIVVLKAIACACWLTWLAVSLAIVREVAAWRAGRAAEPLAVARSFQPTIRRLVMTATLLAAASRTVAPSVLPPVAPAVATAPLVGTATAQSPPVEETGTAPVALPTCVVQPRDSLWRLAEVHLGDGMRWRELWDLNRDREQADGRPFTDPNLIHPGWVLTMPADATGLEPAPPPPPPPAPPPSESTGAPQPLPPSTTPAPTTSTPIAPAAPTTAASVDASSGSGADQAVSTDDPDYDVAPILAGVALAAAGVVVSLDRRRRRQVRRGSLRLPTGSLRASEASFRRAADVDGYSRLDLALRNLAHQLRSDPDAAIPSIDVVSIGPAAVEILLAGVTDAPAGPFDVAADGRAWTLPADVGDDDLRTPAAGSAGPSPTLVSVGTVDERTVSIDLESSPCTVVNGDPSDARDLLWTMVVDLATSERADDLEVIVVGPAPSNVDRLDRVRVVPSIDAAVAELSTVVDRTAHDLVGFGVNTAFEARVFGLGDGTAPTVVVVPDADDAAVAPLAELARRRSGLALLATGDLDQPDRELCVEEDTLLVKPLGLVLRPASLPADMVEDAATLLVDASVVDLTIEESPLPTVPDPDDFVVEHDAEGTPIVPPGHIVVRVQGGVEVFGGVRPIERRRSTEFVVYLAMHPEGVNEEQIREALWPEQDPSRSSFNETISRARRALGLDPTGEHHVRHCQHGLYRVGPYVHLETERPAGPGDQQLALPFRGCKGYEWAYTEGIAYALESRSAKSAAAGSVR